MNRTHKIIFAIFFALLGLGLVTGAALAQTNPCSSDLINTTCTIRSGEVFNGNLSAFNSDVTIEDGGRLNGNLDAFNSDLEINGRVTGNLSAFSGNVTLGDSASVNGNLDVVFSNTTISDSAQILGNRTIVSREGITAPGNIQVHKGSGNFLGRFLWLVFISLSMAALGLVAVLIFPKPSGQMVESIHTRPLIAFAIGFLLLISLPFALLLMTITLILIPVVLAVILVIPIVAIFAWVIVGTALCQLLTRLLKWDWAPAINAAVGTLLLTFLAGLLLFIPCIGWVFIFVFLTTGLGAFVMLFMKFRPQIKPAAVQPVPPTPPAAPQPPAEVSTIPSNPSVTENSEASSNDTGNKPE